MGRTPRIAIALLVGTVVHLAVAWGPTVVRTRFPPPPSATSISPSDEACPPLRAWSQDRLWLILVWDMDPRRDVRRLELDNPPRSVLFTDGNDESRWEGRWIAAVRAGWPWASLQSGYERVSPGRGAITLFDGCQLPWHPRPYAFLGNTIVYAGAVYALLALIGVARRRKGCCRACGHRLLAEQDTCPECGHAVRRRVCAA